MNSHMFEKLDEQSPASIRELLKAVLMSENPIEGLESMMRSGLMRRILPEVAELEGERAAQDPVFHPEGNVWEHSKIVISGLIGYDWMVMLAALLHDIGKPASMIKSEDGRIRNPEHAEIGAEMARAVMLRLEFADVDVERVYQLVLLHMKMHKVDQMRPGKLAEILKRKDIRDLIALQHADSMPSIHPKKSRKAFLEAKLAELEQPKVQASAKNFVDGALLISLGFSPGQRFREIISAGAQAQSLSAFADLEGARSWVVQNFQDVA